MISGPFLFWTLGFVCLSSGGFLPTFRCSYSSDWKSPAIALGSIKTLASVLLPASVNHGSNHRQQAQPQERDQEGEEELHPAHALVLDLHCSVQNNDISSHLKA